MDLPARQDLGDFGPFISEFLVGLKDQLLLVLADRVFLDVRIQVIVPPKCKG